MKRNLLLILCICMGIHSYAQLTLEECQQKAQANYPLSLQYQLIERSTSYTLANAAKGNLPQISLHGKVSYQSDATTLPFTLPNLDFQGMSKDQYQIMMEVSQNIWDGGQIHSQKAQVQAQGEEAERQLDVNMYTLRERINQLFFGILLFNEQLNQNTLLQEELQRNLVNIKAYCTYGIANEADVDAVRVEILNPRQQRIQIESSRNAYLRMLSLFMGEEVNTNILLQKPDFPLSDTSLSINRPELALYSAQEQTLHIKEQSLKTGYMPRFSLFAQGAYGNPGLNMLKDSFEPYFIVGAKVSWRFGSLYTLKNDRKKLHTERLQVQNNRDVFLLNTRIALTEQEQAIHSLRKQMEEDDEMIRLRINIRKAAEAKVANGTLTVTEMLRELTHESLAKQNKALHEIQLLMKLYQQKHITNE